MGGPIGKRRHIRAKLRKNPTLNPRYLAACYGKIRYGKADKERALAGKPSSVKFYHCDFCKFYHIGRRPK